MSILKIVFFLPSQNVKLVNLKVIIVIDINQPNRNYFLFFSFLNRFLIE